VADGLAVTGADAALKRGQLAAQSQVVDQTRAARRQQRPALAGLIVE
jgi:hypothetical protein